MQSSLPSRIGCHRHCRRTVCNAEGQSGTGSRAAKTGQQKVQRSLPPYRQSLEGKQSINSDRGESLSPTPAMMTCRVSMKMSMRGLLTLGLSLSAGAVRS